MNENFLILNIFSKLIYLFLPFLLAFILSSLIEPLVISLEKKLRIPRKIAVIILLFVIFALLGLIFTFTLSRLIKELMLWSASLPGYCIEFSHTLNHFFSKLSLSFVGLPEGVTKNFEALLQTYAQKFSQGLSGVIKMILQAIISLPQRLIFITVTFLSTYFISADRKTVSVFLEHRLPERLVYKIRMIQRSLLRLFQGYMKAQLLLMTITFTVLLFGFLLMGVRPSLTLAILISMIDLLPILGTGIILVPWALYHFLNRNTGLSISLLILYTTILLLRQIIEPRIVGKQIGVHPLFTLMSMYLGLKLLGFWGLILGPVILVILKSIITSRKF